MRRNEPRKDHHLLEVDWTTMIVKQVDDLDLPLVVHRHLDPDPRLLVVLLLGTTLDHHHHLDEVDILLPHPLVVDGIQTLDRLPLVDRIIELDREPRWIRG